MIIRQKYFGVGKMIEDPKQRDLWKLALHVMESIEEHGNEVGRGFVGT